MLTKDQILDADDQQTEIVNVPEWGGDVKIAVMSGFARDRFEASIVGTGGGTNMQNIRAKMCAASIVDENSELMFSDKDIQKLGKKSSAALDRVFSAAKKLNKMSDDDVEELAKN
jgi:hypothetical protein